MLRGLMLLGQWSVVTGAAVSALAMAHVVQYQFAWSPVLFGGLLVAAFGFASWRSLKASLRMGRRPSSSTALQSVVFLDQSLKWWLKGLRLPRR